MSDLRKVMKGEPVILEHLRYPLWVTPKLNGVRGHVQKNTVLSTSNKPLPNVNLQRMFGLCNHWDGEFLVGPPTESQHSLNRTTSVVMSDDKPLGDLKFYAFDHIEFPHEPFRERVARLEKLDCNLKHPLVVVLMNQLIRCEKELLDVEAKFVELGYEGLITRDPDAPHKAGKSTAIQAWMGKLKRFSDDEAEIIGFVEQERNTNEAYKDELGRTKRSSAKAGKVTKGTLGSVVLRKKNGVVFNCGTGFNNAERDEIWNNQEKYLGRLGKYKFFEIGSGDVPVLPVWLGLRSKLDL